MREIRNHPEFSRISKVWPFETHFTRSPSLTDGACVIHAEIWPGIVNDQLEEPPIRDEAQVRAMVRWAANEDAKGGLATWFDSPVGLDHRQIGVCIHEEGWILGSA